MRNVNHMSHECMINSHYFAEIRLKIGQYRVEIFQNQEITNMLENALQGIACYFDALQGL